MFRKKGTIKFVGRVHSKNGIISAILGIAAIITFAAISFISGKNHGNGNLLLGVIGLIAFAVSIFGFILGVKSFKEKDIFYVAPIIGVGSNGLMTITLFCLYIVGMVV